MSATQPPRHIYEQVAIEFETDTKDKALWIKALAEARGNREHADGLYIDQRAAELWAAEKEASAERARASARKDRSTSSCQSKSSSAESTNQSTHRNENAGGCDRKKSFNELNEDLLRAMEKRAQAYQRKSRAESTDQRAHSGYKNSSSHQKKNVQLRRLASGSAGESADMNTATKTKSAKHIWDEYDEFNVKLVLGVVLVFVLIFMLPMTLL